MPDANGIYVTKSDIAGLGGYLAELQAWVEAAGGCLGVKP